MISFEGKGDWSDSTNFLKRLINEDIFSELDRYGKMGVQALSNATPQRTGEASISWEYRVIKDKKHPGIEWYSTDVTAQGTPIVVLIQYGHATGTGGYVPGFDFINPVMRPIFDQITDDIWKRVRS